MCSLKSAEAVRSKSAVTALGHETRRRRLLNGHDAPDPDRPKDDRRQLGSSGCIRSMGHQSVKVGALRVLQRIQES
jgi:hypothetical protein